MTKYLWTNIDVIYVMGCTCVGKSTFISIAKDIYGDFVETIEVGKKMREKYLDPASPDFSPDYFKGQMAPDHAQKEAWNIYLSEMQEIQNRIYKPQFVLVDGQPRSTRQLDKILESSNLVKPDLLLKVRPKFLQLHCPQHVQHERLKKRFGIYRNNEDSVLNDEYNLCRNRLRTDYTSAFNLHIEFMAKRILPHTFNTALVDETTDDYRIDIYRVIEFMRSFQYKDYL